jgi:MFS family permease
MTFAFRARLETVFGPAGAGLTLEQLGYAFMPAFWGFTIAMVVGGPIVDFLGMRRGMIFAFVLHAIGIVGTLLASGFESLFAATVFMGLGNGMVEAVCNPLVASTYPDQKVKMLNRFHLWWPVGIVTGSILVRVTQGSCILYDNTHDTFFTSATTESGSFHKFRW